jgi:acyl-CoA thioester hydrolase
MPGIFEFHHTVRNEEIDDQGHANNVCYVAWMQDAALAHSATQGWPPEAYQRIGMGWVARSHTIQYHHRAGAGAPIVVVTGVAEFKRVTSVRRYRIVRQSDGGLLATAETKWAFIDYATVQPCRVPAEVVKAFEIVETPSA